MSPIGGKQKLRMAHGPRMPRNRDVKIVHLILSRREISHDSGDIPATVAAFRRTTKIKIILHWIMRRAVGPNNNIENSGNANSIA
jgi:hypothetical protein